MFFFFCFVDIHGIPNNACNRCDKWVKPKDKNKEGEEEGEEEQEEGESGHEPEEQPVQLLRSIEVDARTLLSCY